MMMIVLLLLLGLSSVAQAATYWVSKTGGTTTSSCLNNATDPGVYLRTIEQGLNCLTSGGSTVNIKAGTYPETINWSDKAGTSFGNALTIQGGIGGETIWSVPSGEDIALSMRNIQYAIFKNITFDGTNGDNQTPNYKSTFTTPGADKLMHISCTNATTTGGTGCSAHIRIENCILRNSAYIAASIAVVQDIQFLNNEIYNIGKLQNTIAMYHSGYDSLYDGNHFHDLLGGAINLWNETDATVHNNVVRNNKVERSGFFWAPTSENGGPECCCVNPDGNGDCQSFMVSGETCGGGLTCNRFVQGVAGPYGGFTAYISRGTGNQVYNNTQWNSFGGITAGNGASNCLIANNSIDGQRCNEAPAFYGYGNVCPSISVGSDTTNCTVRNNIIWQPGRSGASISVDGPGNVADHNLCTNASSECATTGNPLYVSPSTGGLNLQATSPARDAGVAIAQVTQDILGIARPQGGAYDMGAYEYVDEAPPEPVGNVAWWKFDEGAGSSAADSTGLGHTLSAQGNAGWIAPGAVGPYATHLDGVGDSWTTALTADLKPASQFSITGWMRPACASGELFSAGDSYGAEITSAGDLVCYYYDGAAWPGLSTSGLNLCDGAWHHFGCVKSATALLAYTDGVLRSSVPLTGNISYTLGTNALVGRSFTSSGLDFSGDIDHLRLYDTGISQQGYLNDYNEAVPGVGFVVTHCTYTQADAALGLPRGEVDGDIPNAVSTPIGIRCSVHYSGANPTPSSEYFRWFCNVNGGAFTQLTNSLSPLGVRVHTDTVVGMGDPITTPMLPLDGFTAMNGVVTADTINTSATIAMTSGKHAELEVRIDMGAPVVAGDTVQCRPQRQDGSVMTYQAVSSRSMSLTSDPSSSSASGAWRGGARK